MGINNDLGTFYIEYTMRKKEAIEKRLTENHNYINKQIVDIFEKYNGDLEKIEDIILLAEEKNKLVA